MNSAVCGNSKLRNIHQKATVKNHLIIQYNLNCCYYLGTGVEKKNDQKAFELYRPTKAIEVCRHVAGRGDEQAQYSLGLCVDIEQGSPELFQKAADHEYAPASSVINRY